MADELFQDVVYGESWWINSTKNIFNFPSSSILDPIIGQYFAWPSSEYLDMKIINRSNIDDYYNSSSDDSMFFQELPKNNHHNLSSMDYSSTIQILGVNGNSSSSPASSASPDWNQSLQEILVNSSQNYQQENELKRNFSSISSEDNSSFHKPKNQDFNYYSDLLQTLFDDPHDQEQPQQSLFPNNNPINYAPSSTKYQRQNLNVFEPSLPKVARKSEQLIVEVYFDKHLMIVQSKSSSTTKNSTNEEPTYKRQRIETPSPFPTFKVRKEKLGDRITALQQLVSPFGKTDTASVLQEAIDYIKFLHDQVNVLRTPYVKNNGSPTQHHQQVKEQEGLLKQDLRSKGFCLVPISSTFPVAAETTMDFWTPTFGGTFK